ncbi:hypothetical protein KEJ21_04205, partial [Candidatus Bathyarchaeota archaeon]|nr:hypothetical protein [Candidatus Bathyarchaeota archaeon]
MENRFNSRRGLSPVVATIILVSIVIVVSIAIAFWSSGVSSSYYKSERVEIIHSSCVYLNDTWVISLSLKNTGSSNVLVKQCFINDLEVDSYGARTPGQGRSCTDIPEDGLRMSSGESASIMVYIDGPEFSGSYGTLSAGTSVNLKLLTSSGMAYSRIVELVGGERTVAHFISSNASSGGSVSPLGTVEVIEGYNKTFQISPDEGYHIYDVVVDEVHLGPVQTYTFANVRENHTIYASFRVNVQAIVVYMSSTLSGDTYPKLRFFNGSWTGELELEQSGESVRVFRSVSNPQRYEAIVVVLGSSGNLDAYVYNGATWTHTNLGRVWASPPGGYTTLRPFDVAYESSSGRAIVVYNMYTSDASKDIAYRLWDGSSWSSEMYLNDPYSSKKTYTFISLASNPNSSSNEIALLGIDQNRWAASWIWDGSSWTRFNRICTTGYLATSYVYECGSIAYEHSSGAAVVAVASNLNVRWARYNGVWSSTQTFTMGSNNIYWLILKPNQRSSSNLMMLMSLDAGRDIYTRVWDGSSWSNSSLIDDNVQISSRRCVDGDWEPQSDRFLLVAGDSGINPLSYKTWTPVDGWSPSSVNMWNRFSGLTKAQRWVQVKANPKGSAPLILIGTIDNDQDLVITTWDG